MVKKKSIYPYLLVAPALIIILCVVFIPVINAIGMSFQSYDLRRPNDIAFVGLANYIAAFKDELFWKALWKTILWVVFGVGFQFVFGFILALLLNKKFRGRGVVRAVIGNDKNIYKFFRIFLKFDAFDKTADNVAFVSCGDDERKMMQF